MKLTYRTSFLSFALLLISFTVFPQSQIDSLKKNLETAKHDTTRINALCSLAKQTLILKNNNIEEAQKYAARAVEIAERNNGGNDAALKWLAMAYSAKGIVNLYANNYSESLKYYFISLEASKKRGDSLLSAYLYNAIANTYEKQGNYQEAIKNGFNALKIYEQKGNSHGIGQSYNNIGMIYQTQNSYEEALKNYFKALKIAEQSNDEIVISNVSNNIGVIYKKQGSYQKALEYYFKVLEIQKKLDRQEQISFAYSNIANAYCSLEDYSEALKNYHLSLEISEKIGNKVGIANYYANVGYLYLKQKKFPEAEKYFFTALTYYKTRNDKVAILIMYEDLTMLYKATKKHEKALEYYELYVAHKDSLINDGNKKEMMRSAMQYEFEKKEAMAKLEQEKKDAVQKTEIETKNAQIKLYISVSIIVLILLIGIVLYVQNRRKTEKLELAKNIAELEQKALRLQMNPHFIFNALNSIQGLITENDTLSAKKYLAKFARLMRLILENSTEPTVSLQNEIEVLNNYLELTALRFLNRFDFSITVDQQIEIEEVKIPPMLLQPFVENAALHGIAERVTGGNIIIDFRKKNNSIECIIEDNGIGRQKAMEHRESSHKSIGMLVTEERLKILSEKNNKNEAKLNVIDLFDTFGKPCGTKVIVEIPIHPS